MWVVLSYVSLPFYFLYLRHLQTLFVMPCDAECPLKICQKWCNDDPTKIGQTMTVNRPPYALKVSCELVSGVNSLTGMQVQTCFRTMIILHTAHDAAKNGKVYAVSVDVTVGLLIAICSRRGRLPDRKGDKTGWLIKSGDSKFVGNLFVL
jgi:hypothetical protein